MYIYEQFNPSFLDSEQQRRRSDLPPSFSYFVKACILFIGTYPYYYHYEPRCEKIGLRGFRPGPIQTRLYVTREYGFESALEKGKQIKR